MPEFFETMLSGGHPNSLGRTIEVVDCVLADPSRLDELFACYRSSDEVVRLRVSNAMKRVAAEDLHLLVPFIDSLIVEIGELDQASAQWTLAQLFLRLEYHLSPEQRAGALAVMKRNLASHDDWIVLNQTLETLSRWAIADPALKDWLKPYVERLAAEPRKSIAKRAARVRQSLYGN